MLYLLFWSKELVQKNKFPIVKLQNSTYQIYLKTSNTIYETIQNKYNGHFKYNNNNILIQNTPCLSASGAVHLIGNFPASTT